MEFIAAYWKFAKEYYQPQPGGSDGELDGIRLALGHLKRLYADTPAAAFGPLSLKAVRDAMVKAGWCRTYINLQTNRIRRAIKWAVENELVPACVRFPTIQPAEGAAAAPPAQDSGVNSSSLTAQQAEVLRDGVGRMLGYVGRIMMRMQIQAWPRDDRMQSSTSEFSLRLAPTHLVYHPQRPCLRFRQPPQEAQLEHHRLVQVPRPKATGCRCSHASWGSGRPPGIGQALGSPPSSADAAHVLTLLYARTPVAVIWKCLGWSFRRRRV